MLHKMLLHTNESSAQDRFQFDYNVYSVENEIFAFEFYISWNEIQFSLISLSIVCIELVNIYARHGF